MPKWEYIRVWAWAGRTPGVLLQRSLEEGAGLAELRFEAVDGRIGQKGEVILGALEVEHAELVMAKIDVFDPQAQAFAQAQAAAVEQKGHELPWRPESINEGVDFRAGEHDGQVPGRFGAGELAELAGIDLKDVFIEKDNGVEGLVLGAWSHFQVPGQMSEERADFIFAHVAWMTAVVEKNKASYPTGVSFLGAQAVVHEAAQGAELSEEFGLGRGWRGSVRRRLAGGRIRGKGF